MIIRSDYVFSNGENEHEQFTKFNVSAVANDQDEAGVVIQASTDNNGEAAASIAVVESQMPFHKYIDLCFSLTNDAESILKQKLQLCLEGKSMNGEVVDTYTLLINRSQIQIEITDLRSMLLKHTTELDNLPNARFSKAEVQGAADFAEDEIEAMEAEIPCISLLCFNSF